MLNTPHKHRHKHSESSETHKPAHTYRIDIHSITQDYGKRNNKIRKDDKSHDTHVLRHLTHHLRTTKEGHNMNKTKVEASTDKTAPFFTPCAPSPQMPSPFQLTAENSGETQSTGPHLSHPLNANAFLLYEHFQRPRTHGSATPFLFLGSHHHMNHIFTTLFLPCTSK